jgi:hypothetical protein
LHSQKMWTGNPRMRWKNIYKYRVLEQGDKDVKGGLLGLQPGTGSTGLDQAGPGLNPGPSPDRILFIYLFVSEKK